MPQTIEVLASRYDGISPEHARVAADLRAMLAVFRAAVAWVTAHGDDMHQSSADYDLIVAVKAAQ